MVFTRDFSPNVRPVLALIARLHITMGRTREAMAWARERRLTADDELSYVHEFNHITLALALLAQYAAKQDQNCLRDAARLLERLLIAAEHGGRMRSVIEILLLQAQAHRAAGGVHSSQRALSEPLLSRSRKATSVSSSTKDNRPRQR